MRFKLFVFIGCLLLSKNANAQNGSVSIQPIYDTQVHLAPSGDNFCELLMQLVSDASSGFSRAKGKQIETDANTEIWSANMGLPGAKTSSLIFTTLWQYEGVVYQGPSVDDIRVYYDKYKKLLDACLSSTGYDANSEKNMEPKLEKYPQQAYYKPSGEGARITMKADNADNTGTYTLTVNVFQVAR